MRMRWNHGITGVAERRGDCLTVVVVHVIHGWRTEKRSFYLVVTEPSQCIHVVTSSYESVRNF